VGLLAEAGEAIHAAFGSVLRSWIESHGAQSLSDLRQDVELEVRGSRPDIQPEAIRGCQNSIWSWARLIHGIHPGNVLRFDGGENERCGQLALDIPDLDVRLTSELDLLYATESPEVLDEVDYKTGWKVHDVGSVADSFQFQLHALLVFENYPGVNCLRLRVFDTRSNSITYMVPFTRSRQHDYMVRVRAAVGARIEHWENPPTWPAREKCSICPVACLCPVVDQDIGELAKDPPGFVKRLVAVEARADAMRELAAKYVDANGQDIQSGGVAFGRRKPATERKKPATLYDLSNQE
jgi:hypothetical protein